MKALHLIPAYCLLLVGCKMSDLQTEVSKTNPDSQQARVLLEQMAEAHGAYGFTKLDTYAVAMEDEFYGAMGGMISPYKSKVGQFTGQFIPDTFDGQLAFTGGPLAGQAWGIQSWQTYERATDQTLTWKEKSNGYFWIPTYQYFIEFPLRILQANVLALAGKKTIMGHDCLGVIASWGDLAPQKDTDQYLIWMDATTHQLVKLEYTVREMAGFVTGAALYADYQNYGGILLPRTMSVGPKAEEGTYMHQMRILGFTANPVSQSELRPNADLRAMGDAKPE